MQHTHGSASTLILRATALAALVLLTACAGTEDRPPPEVEAGRPDWTRESGSLSDDKSRTAKPAAGKPDYRVSETRDIEAEAEAHRQSLLASDAKTLHPNEVGYYVDTLEARLVQTMSESEIRWERQVNTIVFTLGGGDTFASNTSRVSESARAELAPVARILEEYDRTRVSIYGHTDDVGDEGYNQRLSVWRAQAIASLLVKAGVAAERLFIVGYGETQPVADNSTEAGRARNRRIALVVEPLERPITPMPDSETASNGQ